jgi:hypothetical protein
MLFSSGNMSQCGFFFSFLDLIGTKKKKKEKRII